MTNTKSNNNRPANKQQRRGVPLSEAGDLYRRSRNRPVNKPTEEAVAVQESLPDSVRPEEPTADIKEDEVMKQKQTPPAPAPEARLGDKGLAEIMNLCRTVSFVGIGISAMAAEYNRLKEELEAKRAIPAAA